MKDNFSEYGLPNKIISGTGTIFVSEMFENGLLQKTGLVSCCVMIIQPPEQWTGRSMHQICKAKNKNAMKLMLIDIYLCCRNDQFQ